MSQVDSGKKVCIAQNFVQIKISLESLVPVVQNLKKG